MVRPVELARDLDRALALFTEQQLERRVGAVEAPRGVQSRRDAERDVALVDARGVERETGHQGPQARLRGSRQGPQAVADQRAVLADQRYDVGDRRDRDEVEITVARGGVDAALTLDGLRELVGHGRAAERRERVAAESRMDDRCVGDLGGRRVVVGDDHVEAQVARQAHLLDGADRAVRGDDQRGAACRQRPHGVGGQPVAVAAVGNVTVDVGAETAQRTDKHSGRADAVGVVVAVDRYPPAGADVIEELLDGVLDAGELLGLVVLAGVEKGAGGGRRAEPAAHEDLREHVTDGEALAQREHLLGRARRHLQ